jgi:hypothetical protein
VQLASAPNKMHIKVPMTHDPAALQRQKSKQITADIPQLGEEV